MRQMWAGTRREQPTPKPKPNGPHILIGKAPRPLRRSCAHCLRSALTLRVEAFLRVAAGPVVNSHYIALQCASNPATSTGGSSDLRLIHRDLHGSESCRWAEAISAGVVDWELDGVGRRSVHQMPRHILMQADMGPSC